MPRATWILAALVFLAVAMFPSVPHFSGARAGAASPAAVHLDVLGQLGGASRAVGVLGDHAYVGMGDRLVVLDVADPGTPRQVGELAAQSAVQGFVVAGELGYLLTADGGLQVLDLGVPANPRLVGALAPPLTAAQAMAVSDGYAYLAASDGLRVVDVHDATAPRGVGFAPTAGRLVDIAIAGKQAYAAAEGGGLVRIDVADPTQPRVADTMDLGGTVTAVGVAEHLVVAASDPPGQFCAGGSRSTGLTPPSPNATCLLVLDGTDPERPATFSSVEIVDQSTNGTWIPAGGIRWVDGGLFVLDGNAGYFGGHYSHLHRFNLTDPARPVQRMDMILSGAQGLAVAAGRAYTALEDGGLEAVDVRDPASPAIVGTFRAPGDAQAVAAMANHVYVGDPQRVGIESVDLGDPTRPREVGFVRVGFNGHGQHEVVTDLATDGVSLYSVCGYLGLMMFDVSTPAAPKQIGGWANGLADTQTVAVNGHLAVVGAGDSILHVIDVTDRAHPVEVGSLTLAAGRPPLDVAATGGWVYVVDGQTLQVVDIAEPAHPRVVRRVDPSVGATGVALGSGHVLVTGAAGGVAVIDGTAPDAAREVGSLAGTATGGGGAIAASGAYAVVGNGPAEVWAVDVSDPAHPRLAAAAPISDPAVAMTADGARVYVAAGLGGLIVLGLTMDGTPPTPTTGPSPTATASASPTVSPTGTPPRRHLYLPNAATGAH